MEKAFELQISDRVKKADRRGCVGTITDIREELVPTRGDTSDKALLCKVLWDDGIESYYEINKLQKIK